MIEFNNSWDEISLTTLKEYIGNFHNNLFVNKHNLEILLKKEEISNDIYKFNDDEVGLICNYEEIVRLIYYSLDTSMNLEEYFSFYNECLIENKKGLRYNQIAQIMEKPKDERYEKAVKLLEEYIKYAKLKYGSDKVAYYLEIYVNGNNNAITRDNNYRNNFIVYLPPDMVKFITKNNIKGYIDNCLNSKTTQNINSR